VRSFACAECSVPPLPLFPMSSPVLTMPLSSLCVARAASAITNSDIAGHLKLPPVKLHCSMLAEDAIKAAVQDYKTKNNA
jgi:hypothetical protein